MVAATGADELKQVGITTFEAAVHDVGRLAPQECCPAVAVLARTRDGHNVAGPDAKPRVPTMIRGRRGDGGRTDRWSGIGHAVRVTKIAQFTHRQPVVPVAAGVQSNDIALSPDDTRTLIGAARNCLTLTCPGLEEPWPGSQAVAAATVSATRFGH